MPSPTFAEFEAAARLQGFDECLERQWKPDTLLGTHSHDFAIDAIVVQGEMWLTVGEQVRHMRAGDRFDLASGIPHAERYGAEGTTLWVARRSA